jgi:hypothetical protein
MPTVTHCIWIHARHQPVSAKRFAPFLTQKPGIWQVEKLGNLTGIRNDTWIANGSWLYLRIAGLKDLSAKILGFFVAWQQLDKTIFKTD